MRSLVSLTKGLRNGNGVLIVRLFIGIEFPAVILDQLLEIRNQMRANTKRGRFVARENLHLTLQFLGDLPAQKVEPLVQVLRQTAQDHSQFSLALKNAGGFGNGRIYRVVWVGIAGDIQILNCLQKDISISLHNLGFPPETKAYQPHITLGRDVEFFEEASFERYSPAIAELPFPVKQFSLIESKLENGKRNYHQLSSFSLEKGRI